MIAFIVISYQLDIFDVDLFEADLINIVITISLFRIYSCAVAERYFRQLRQHRNGRRSTKSWRLDRNRM